MTKEQPMSSGIVRLLTNGMILPIAVVLVGLLCFARFLWPLRRNSNDRLRERIPNMSCTQCNSLVMLLVCLFSETSK